MKIKNFFIILICLVLIIFLIFISKNKNFDIYKNQAIKNKEKIEPTIEQKETNFINLKIISHKYAPGRVSIAIDSDKNILYAAYLDTNIIDAFQIKDFFHLNKIDSFEVPLNDKEIPHILDLHYSSKKLLISIVKIKDEHECTTTELYELDPQKKFLKNYLYPPPVFLEKIFGMALMVS